MFPLLWQNSTPLNPRKEEALPHSVETHPLPSERIGTSRSLTVHRFGTPGTRPKVYIQAGLHADETPGFLTAHHLIRRLASARVLGEVVVVPVANPVGLSQVVKGTHVGRYALNDGGNFNRGFADLAEAAQARVQGRLGPDAAANVALIRGALRDAHAEVRPGDEIAAMKHALLGLALDADLVLDLHCDMEAVVHLYTGDALWPELADLAADLGAEAVLLASDSGGPPFDEACSATWWRLSERLGAEGPVPPACAAVTVELRGKADVDDARATADAEAILRTLVRRGVVEGDPVPLPDPACEATPLAGLARVIAPASGVIAFRRSVGDRVEAGETVAEIVDPTAKDPDAARIALTAPVAGLVMARSNVRFAGRGDLIASIAGAAALPASGRGLLFD